MARGDVVASVEDADNKYIVEETFDGYLRFVGDYLTVDGIRSNRYLESVPSNTLRPMFSFPDGEGEEWHEVYTMGFSHKQTCEPCWIKRGQIHFRGNFPGRTCKLVERQIL